MNLRTYRAYTMAEALAAVKRDLGVDATVVHTRSYKRGGILGLGRRTVVEITAATAEDARLLRNQSGLVKETGSKSATRPHASRRPRSTVAQRAYQQATGQTDDIKSVAPDAMSHSLPAQDLESKRLDLLAAIEDHKRNTSNASNRSTQPDAIAGTEIRPGRATVQSRRFIPLEKPAEPTDPAAEIGNTASPSKTSPQSEREPVARRYVLKPTEQQQSDERPISIAAPGPVPTTEKATPAHTIADDALDAQREMHTIRDMVSRILDNQQRQRSGNEHSSPMPQHLFDLYLRLVEQDMADEIADSIARAVQRSLSSVELEQPDIVAAAMRDRLIQLVPTCASTLPGTTPNGRPWTVALVGPTGVGKTTTLAKLAATFKLKHNLRVGLITCDTYRIAAVEQLKTYANIIGLPVKVVMTPEDMRAACRQLRDCDVLLIDTAGRSQRDDTKLVELSKFIDVADPHEVHLVLSSTASEKVLMHEAEAFSRVRVDRIILTKLDEAVSFGMLVNVMRKVGKSLSFVTTGQEVPDDIEPGDGGRFADLVLGQTTMAGAT